MRGVRTTAKWRVFATMMATAAVGALQAVASAPAGATTPLDCTAAVGNLVQNCGFESSAAIFTNWVLSPGSVGTFVNSGATNPHSGANWAAFGSTSGDESISQVITGTDVGDIYELSFWIGAINGATNTDLSAVVQNTSLGDVTAATVVNPGTLAYAEHDFVFSPNPDGTPPALVFKGQDHPSWIDLDDVEVVLAHKVTFSSTFGAPTPPVQVVQDGLTATVPASPSVSGGTFLGWYTALTGGQLWNFAADPITMDTTLYAQYAFAGAPNNGVGGVATTTAVTTLNTATSQTVFGQPAVVTATVAPASPLQACSVLEWIVDGTRYGNDVPVSSQVTVPGGAQFTLGPLTGLGVGQHHVEAYFPNCPGVDVTDVAQTVVPDATTTALTYTDGIAHATVTAAGPGAGTPAGSVTFYRGPSPVATAPLGSDGQAQTPIVLPKGSSLTATYSGDQQFNGSSGVRSGSYVLNPYLAADVSGAHAKTKFGWYRSAVKVSFECKPGSAALAGGCPGAVRLTKSKAGQSVSETVRGTDGGVTSVKVAKINIDRVAPTLHVTRHGSKLTCYATDALSGVASCTVAHDKRLWVATAIDKAGNKTTKKGYEV